MYTKTLAEIISNKKIANETYDMLIKTPQARAALPGQFVTILCGEKVLRRPISICEIDKNADTIRLVYAVKGEGTSWISKQVAGGKLDVLGPIGRGFNTKKAKNIVFVGGGIGTPPLIQAAISSNANCDAILGFRNKNFVILKEDYIKSCKSVTICTDDGSEGFKGLVTEKLNDRLAKSECDLICACGPTVMLKAVSDIAHKNGIECQVSLEERMGCGIGACLVCVCKIKNGDDYRHLQVCRYGPVIDSKEVIW